MAISLEPSCLFPTLLQLSTRGEGLGSSFPRGCSRAVSCQKLGCGSGWAGLGAVVRALPEDSTGIGGQCGCHDCHVLVLGLP